MFSYTFPSYICTEFIIYDDACHLKRYACNPIRSSESDTAKKIAKANIVVDRFHFPGHIDLWCQENCNPNKFDELIKVKLHTLSCNIVSTCIANILL